MPPFFPNFPNQGNQGGPGPMPMGPPPAQTPQKPQEQMLRAVDPGTIRNCLGRYTYVWLSNGQEFWFFPTQVWRNSVGGFIWHHWFGWVYTGISLDQISMFTCAW